MTREEIMALDTEALEERAEAIAVETAEADKETLETLNAELDAIAERREVIAEEIETRKKAEEAVLKGEGEVKAGDIITIIEDYSFLDDGTAYQMVPLYAPPIYENEEYLIIISPDGHEYINVENAWDVRAAILIDEFSRNYEQYSIEEALRFEQKRGYFDRFDIAKEMIERFVDGK